MRKHAMKKIDSFELMQLGKTDTVLAYDRPQRPRMALAIRVALIAGAIAVIAGAALATPWTDENGNPNPDCTGSCHETGIPNPPEPSKPEPKQSHEGEPTGVLRCGCGYVVILRDGVSKAAAKRACEAAVPVGKECKK